MAKTIPVRAEDTVLYTIELERAFVKLPKRLTELGYRPEQKICIVTDSNVSKLYLSEVKDLLENEFSVVTSYCMQAGEENKNLQTVGGLYEHLILHHFDRNDLLLALGGGVVGDLTGFTAATYLRGIDFIQVPTTLLSQVDSSIGGKTGVDFLQYKNMVGAFYQPKLVYMNVSVLRSLPKIQFVSGMAEIIKHGLIKDAAYYQWLKEKQEEILALSPPILEEMIEKSCHIKREVVERDPNEKGERALLNFGHTIGHAVEKLSDFRMSHGACVGIGMLAATYLSWKMGMLAKEDLAELETLLASYGFQTRISGFSPTDILLATKSDKKMDGNRIRFILLKAIGEAYICKDLTDDDLIMGIQSICAEEAERGR